MMATNPSNEQYQKAAELAEAGKYEEALALMEQYLDQTPGDAQAWNDAAVLLHCLGRSDLAVEYLDRARGLSDDPRIVWNLVEALLAQADLERALGLFGELEKAGILSTDALNRAACLCLGEGRLQQAADLLEWSCRIDPAQGQVLGQMIQKIRSRSDATTTQ
ncbi:MAG: tetratricopeptide repeat protein [Sedimentisphaerales bacterium]|jgi:tetratricopeptide (TPR) repeat protein|nr:tetratricopeptide repeat protein [Sedimentisphaerales bacterium]